MAFGGFSQGETHAPNSEINMVPLIDVMLVLLIVFMVTAPLLTHAVKIDLPRAASQPADPRPDSVALAMDATGRIFWNDEAVDEGALPGRLAAAAAQTPQPELNLRADRDTPYGKIAGVMSQARTAGIAKMGFVTQPEGEK